MNPDLQKSLVTAVLTAFAGGAVKVLLSYLEKGKSNKPDNATATADTHELHRPSSTTPRDPSSTLVDSLAEIVPGAVWRPSEVPLGSIVASIGGLLVGLNLLPAFNTIQKAIAIADSDSFAAAATRIATLGVGAIITYSGYRLHQETIEIGRRNGTVLLSVIDCCTRHDDFLKRWRRRLS